jgi:two-component system, cell cycle sensor histidine kinase and response regulator CckA
MPTTPITVLLVDDDPYIRRSACRILTLDGYYVLEAADGAEALSIASTYGGPIHLLLTDVIMPNLNGLLLAERLLKERPGAGVLYMSGYVESTLISAVVRGAALLRKPFSPEVLLAAVRGVVGSQPEKWPPGDEEHE